MGNTSSTKTTPVPPPTIPLILVGDLTKVSTRTLRRRSVSNLLRMGHCAPTVMQTLLDAPGTEADWLVIIDARNRPGEHDVKPSEIAVSDHGTLGRLTQFPGRSVVPPRKSLKTNGIAEPYDSKEGFALHCSRPSANR